METRIKQWLVVLNEVIQDDKNEYRYYGLFRWTIRHHNARLMMKTVKLNGKLITIATIKFDGNEDDFNEFCAMADKVNGLYCVSDILDTATKVLVNLPNQE